MNRTGTSPRDVGVFLAKLAVSAVLITVVVRRLSLDEIRLAMSAPHWGWLVAALGVYALSAVGGATQWAWILRAAGIQAPGREIRRLYFIGLFFNNFLPANIGGDAYKIVDLGRREKRGLGVFAATVLDRLMGLGALTFLAILFLAAASVAGIELPAISLLLVPVMFLLAVLASLLISRRLGLVVGGALRRLHLTGLADRMEHLSAEFVRFRQQVPWLGRIFLFSVLVQGLRLLTHLVVARGLGLPLDFSQMVQLMVLIPMLAVSLTLPVAINGIGLREEISAKLLTWAGLTETQAVAMELVAFLVMVVFSLQGGLLLWLGRWGRNPRSSSGSPE
jgi:uncharacterized protein (TIRG00374 family)|nr:lysylphosphatidylglycerol synthase transmembrane domain-containing protein [Candidatus Krumholzibacteria bacterium]